MRVQGRVQGPEASKQLEQQGFVTSCLRAWGGASTNSAPEFWVDEGATPQDRERWRSRFGGGDEDFSLSILSLRC